MPSAFLSSLREELAARGRIFFAVRVSPGAKKTEIAGLLEPSDSAPILKVRVAAAPEKGRANKELLRFFAKIFLGEIRILAGHASTEKALEVRAPLGFVRSS